MHVAHVVTELAPVAVENVPALQTAGVTVAAVGQYEPEGQVWQVELDVAPRAAEYLPAGQATIDEPPEQYEPPVQVAQVEMDD